METYKSKHFSPKSETLEFSIVLIGKRLIHHFMSYPHIPENLVRKIKITY